MTNVVHLADVSDADLNPSELLRRVLDDGGLKSVMVFGVRPDGTGFFDSSNLSSREIIASLELVKAAYVQSVLDGVSD